MAKQPGNDGTGAADPRRATIAALLGIDVTDIEDAEHSQAPPLTAQPAGRPPMARAELLGLDPSDVDRTTAPQPAVQPAVQSAVRPPMTREELINLDTRITPNLLTAAEVATVLRVTRNGIRICPTRRPARDSRGAVSGGPACGCDRAGSSTRRSRGTSPSADAFRRRRRPR